jgi:hypothetical protein
VLAVLFLAYEVVRLGASDALRPAMGHARTVLDVEGHLGLDVEAWLNQGLVHVRWLEVAASYWYASLHYLVTPVVLVLLYRRAPQRYRQARTALVLATGSALIGYLAFPTAPPRLLPGYTDALRETADVGWWSDAGSAVRGAASAVNDLAAMPSMHVGWALWCGLALATLARTRGRRALALGYPVITTLVVVATANHWVLDAVVGAALVSLAWCATHVGDRPAGPPPLLGRTAPTAVRPTAGIHTAAPGPSNVS